MDEEDNRLIEEASIDDKFSTLPKRVEFINSCRVALNGQFASDNSFLFNLTHFVGHAFVSFQYQHYRNFFLDAYQADSKRFIYNGRALRIRPANHPEDINWKNLRFSVQEKERIQLNTYFIMLLIILVEFAILYGLKYLLYNDGSVIEASFTAHPFVFMTVATVVVLLTNTIIIRVAKSSARAERHKTRLNETTAFIKKSMITTVISSTLTFFFLDIMQGSHDNLHYYGHYFIAISSGLEILYQLINPPATWRSFQIWWHFRKLKNTDTVNKFQYQLNAEMAHPEFPMARRYIYLIYKAYVALFFLEPAPLGLPITLLTLMIMYWLDKINLFSRSSLHYAGNIAISNYLLKTMQFSLLLYAGAFFFFKCLDQDKLVLFLGIATLVALLYVIFMLAAPKTLERCVYGRETASSKYIYDECVSDGKFDDTY